MKLGKNEKTDTKPAETSVKPDVSLDALESMEPASANNVDGAGIMQYSVYNAGVTLLKSLGDNIDGSATNSSFQEVAKRLRELKDFTFDIGFAGEQSSGKSFVVNSILGYPLMPCCNLTTTATVVKLVYGKTVRVIASDDDSGKRVLDVDCSAISEERFALLIEYACAVVRKAIIENLQYFTDRNIMDCTKDNPLNISDLQMERTDAKQIALLMLILLSVYVNQDKDEEKNDAIVTDILQKRTKILKQFGIPQNAVNFTVTVYWDNPMLERGLVITDLPGLGAAGQEKKLEDFGADKGKRKVKTHEEITEAAIFETDAMVFLVDTQVKGAGMPALRAMLSSAKLKNALNKDTRIIPVLNKVDLIKGAGQLETTLAKFVSVLRDCGVKKNATDIWQYRSIYGEYGYDGLELQRSLFYWSDVARNGRPLPKEVYESTKEYHLETLRECYQESNVENLRNFFTKTYVERGKYERSFATLFSVIQLAGDLATPLEAEIKNLRLLIGMAEFLGNTKVLVRFRTGVNNTLNDFISDVGKQTKEVKSDRVLIDAALDNLPGQYILKFENALSDYRSDCLRIAGKFEIAYGGLANSARLDGDSDKAITNRMVYRELKDRMNNLTVDTVLITDSYESILASIGTKIESIYNTVSKSLDTLAHDFPEQVDRMTEKMSKDFGDVKDSGALLQLLRDMEANISGYIEQKSETAKASLANMRNGMTDRSAALAKDIAKMNRKFINSFQGTIASKIRDSEHSGDFFTSRDYVYVDGDYGVKVKINRAYLSEQDKDVMMSDITRLGTMVIKNQMDSWYDDVESEALGILVGLQTEIDRLIFDLIQNVDVYEGDLKDKLNAMTERYLLIKDGYRAFSDETQKLTDDATSLDWVSEDYHFLKGNMFGNKFDFSPERIEETATK